MRGTLMRHYPEQVHKKILASTSSNNEAARMYNEEYDAGVTRQNVAYWRKIFGGERSNMAKADRELKLNRKLRKPDPIIPDRVVTDKVFRSILVIPDQHAPYHHPDALDFLIHVASLVQPDLVINLGDELDYHALSFHDSDPNLDSAGVELEKGKAWLQQLASVFPKQFVCDSNHGSLAFRKAKHHGMPVQLIRSYREVIFPDGGGEGWVWAESWRINTPGGEVMFKHQPSGDIVGDAAHNQCNLMCGHHHGKFSVEYSASSKFLYWGAYSGCLIDKDAMAFAYGKLHRNKPIIGCTVIIDGVPVLYPMRLNSKGRWIKE